MFSTPHESISIDVRCFFTDHVICHSEWIISTFIQDYRRFYITKKTDAVSSLLEVLHNQKHRLSNLRNSEVNFSATQQHVSSII